MYNRPIKKQPSRPITRNPAFRRAIHQLTEALESNSEHANAENIRLIRQAHLADVDAMEDVVLPKRK